MSTAGSRLKNVLSFHEFMRRKEVLSLYKDFIKEVRKIGRDQLRSELELQIRFDFKHNKDMKDNSVVKSLLADGRRELIRLRHLVEDDRYHGQTPHRDGRLGVGWPWESK